MMAARVARAGTRPKASIGGSIALPALAVLFSGMFASGAVAVAPAPAPVCAAGSCTVTFGYSGTAGMWSVPAGVPSAAFDVDGGAGGAGGVTSGGPAAAGGLGSEVQETLPLTPGQAVTVSVAGAGDDATGGGTGGFGDGGGGGTVAPGGGGGGGVSSVSLGGEPELIGGGGGGGGGDGLPAASVFGGAGGAGGVVGVTGDSTTAGATTFNGGGAGQPGVSSGAGAGPGAAGTFGAYSGNDTGCGPLAPVGAASTGGSGQSGGAGGDGSQAGTGGGGGGGGGGGYYGGGGGAGGYAGGDGCASGGGGGGGGSSFAAAGVGATFLAGVRAGNGQITAVYSDPVAAGPRSYTTTADQPLHVAAGIGVLSVASAPSGDPLTASPVTQSKHGSLMLNSDGSFTYTPATGYVGADSFTYEAEDAGGDYATASISVNVTPAPPSATIKTPANDAGYELGQIVKSSFTCTDGLGGTGITACLDQNHHPAGAALDTSTTGSHTYSVTATSADGLTDTVTIRYDVRPLTPRLRALGLEPDAFRAATRGATITTDADLGAAITYRDSVAARTTFRVLRCRATHGRCIPAALDGSFTHRDHAGVNRLRFSGRLRGHELAAGRYVLQATATLAGRVSRTVRATFRILGPRATCYDPDRDGDCDAPGQS